MPTNKTFGRLLKGAMSSIGALEGKSAAIMDDELGDLIGVSFASIQRYKAGHVPEQRTVEILAEAAVRRGQLSHTWLQQFLLAAGHPTPNKVVERLFPRVGGAALPSVYHNLPAPTYSLFVMRAQAYAEVIEGLRQRTPVVLIASLGGMGKTSLALEVAHRSLQDDGDTPRFDAAVWMSDKDQPGTTNLNVVLDEIARTLDYPGILQHEFEEKRRAVEQLLRRQRVLLVIDNFETITDASLFAWVARLPEPSKALVTTREYRREFRRGSWPIELRGMSEEEAYALIALRLRQLRVELPRESMAQFAPLVAATGGNPKAIELALGDLRYGRTLHHMLDDLAAAQGEIFDALFKRAWSRLDVPAQQVLLAMLLFPTSASVEAVAAVADLLQPTIDLAVERLIDLALLDIQQTDLDAAPRYSLHPLVRAFAHDRLREQPGFEAQARERWIRWYIQLASKVGYCWNDLRRLELLDPEHTTVYAAIQWLANHHRHQEVLQLAQALSYYFYVRGFWDKKKAIELMRAEAAHHLGDVAEEVVALAYVVLVLSRQGNHVEAQSPQGRLAELVRSAHLDGEAYATCQVAIASYHMARQEFDTAEQAWRESTSQLGAISAHTAISNRQGLADCLYLQSKLPGCPDQHAKCAEAQRIFRETLDAATRLKAARSVLFNKTKQAAIAIDQGDLTTAAGLLAQCLISAEQYQDQRRAAEIHRLYALLCQAQEQPEQARQHLATAIDLYERMGMIHELEEARAMQADITAKAVSSSDAAPA